MIPAVIRWSIEHRFIVVVLALGLAGWGVWAVGKTPVDAIPDLSDVQVIVKTTYPGQAPQVVEDQVTYPIATAMLSVPGARDVRGFSFFGDSYVYVLFEDGTDLYWARSRVLEYLSQITPRLPEGAVSALGPDATTRSPGWSPCRISTRPLSNNPGVTRRGRKRPPGSDIMTRSARPVRMTASAGTVTASRPSGENSVASANMLGLSRRSGFLKRRRTGRVRVLASTSG